MSYLLDTNVISETICNRPNEAVIQWLRELPNESLYLSVLTLGEIRQGIERLPAGSRREQLRLWLEYDLPNWFGSRILLVDQRIADRWGRLLVEVGRSLPAIDSLLAATALHFELRLVTRNLADFSHPALEVINPWLLS